MPAMSQTPSLSYMLSQATLKVACWVVITASFHTWYASRGICAISSLMCRVLGVSSALPTGYHALME